MEIVSLAARKTRLICLLCCTGMINFLLKHVGAQRKPAEPQRNQSVESGAALTKPQASPTIELGEQINLLIHQSDPSFDAIT
ncbi:MAG: hypothetical protein AAFR26_03410 [Cyanobacteria bacterium J06626_4]